MTAGPADPGVFSSVAGLPLHPLVVHGAVVLLPLSALALIVLLVRPHWRRNFGWLAVATAVVGAIAAYVSRLSGQALAETVGRPDNHAVWGERLSILALVYALLAGVWWVLGRRSPAPGTSSSRILDAGVGVLAAAVLVLTVVVGHSGATAVWGSTDLSGATQPDDALATGPEEGTTDPAEPDETTTDPSDPDETTEPTEPTTGTDAGTTVYSLAEVAEHGSAESCWAAIDGEVYDLTEWIGQHPGGSGRILSICGTDASAAFQGQHGDDARPHQELANFKIGDVG